LQLSNRPKVVITLRGSDTYLWPWVNEKWKKFYSNRGYGIDAFVVQSKDQKAYAVKLGLPKDKVSIIPASISKHNYKIIPKILNKNKKIRFISVHRFTWQKNIQGNLLFIKKISESIPNIEYNIFGKGDSLSTSEIYYLADRLGLSQIVKVKGTNSNSFIRKEFRSYDYILQLSLSESLGVAILEAMQVGVVPIVSNIGGLKDIVENNVNGIINDYFKIDELVKSTLNLNNYPSQYSLMSKNCINFVNNNYDNYNESKKLNLLYKKLLKKHD
jgi:glycosyltransferase involved in cell wall biosynthesis